MFGAVPSASVATYLPSGAIEEVSAVPRFEFSCTDTEAPFAENIGALSFRSLSVT